MFRCRYIPGNDGGVRRYRGGCCFAVTADYGSGFSPIAGIRFLRVPKAKFLLARRLNLLCFSPPPFKWDRVDSE